MRADEWTITLRALPDNVPPTVRLRSALKALLRTWRLRCVELARPPTADDTQATKPTKKRTSNAEGKRRMKISDLFPSKYLKVEDLDGRDRLVTIATADVERIGQGADAEDKLVLTFTGYGKKLPLNKTNARAIAAIVGSDDSENWIGQQIVLFPTRVDFRGDLVDAIRVRAAKRAASPPPVVTPATADEAIPF